MYHIFFNIVFKSIPGNDAKISFKNNFKFLLDITVLICNNSYTTNVTYKFLKESELIHATES